MTAPIISAMPTPPNRSQDQFTFRTNADNWVSAVPTFVSEANTLGSWINNQASTIFGVGQGFAGEWSSLTGSANIPYSVSHNGNLWVLTTNLADITASEPSVSNTDWVATTSQNFVENDGTFELTGDLDISGQADIGTYINFPNSTGTGLASERWIGADGANSAYYNVPTGLVHKFGVNNTDVVDILQGRMDVIGECRIYPSSGTGTLRFGEGSIEKAKISVDTNSNMMFETAGVERARVDSSGRLLLGVVSGSNKLTVRDNISSTVASFGYTAGASSYVEMAGTGSSVFFGNNNGSFSVQTSGSGFSDKMLIAATGDATFNSPTIRQSGSISFDSIISGSDVIQRAVNAGTTYRIQDQVSQDRLAINLGSGAGTVTGEWTFNDNIGAGTAPLSTAQVTIQNTDSKNEVVFSGTDFTNVISDTTSGFQLGNNASADLSFLTNGTVHQTINSSGNVGIGATPVGASKFSVIQSTGADNILRVGTSTDNGFIRSGSGGQTYSIAWNAANAAFYVGSDTTTGRGINSPGTINAGGADYAEYVKKSTDCGQVAKGDVIGFDVNGQITDKFSKVVSGFAVKSTNPNLVGGDLWAISEKPEIIQPNVLEYTGVSKPMEPQKPEKVAKPDPVVKPDKVSEPSFSDYESAEEFEQAKAAYTSYLEKLKIHADYRSALRNYRNYKTLLEEYNVASIQYETNLAQYKADQMQYNQRIADEQARVDKLNTSNYNAWFEIHEAERQTVDRIAFCGVVPVNFEGPFSVGDYLIAVEGDNDTISAKAVSKIGDFDELAVCFGRVKEVEPDTGRPVITVKVGV